ncbi:amidase domain-containing protein [Bacillus sp. JJ1566]|uniref:amidase domain-containing protein n=1 Tax=Bacillus sp. JJ1566 TaxID=3122961 RepID=UPI002FFF916F
MKTTLAKVIETKAQLLVGNTERTSTVKLPDKDLEFIRRKKELLRKRSAEMVKCHTNGQIIGKNEVDGKMHLNYLVHYQYLIRQNKNLYIEEHCEERKAVFTLNKLISDEEVPKEIDNYYEPMDREVPEEDTRSFKYNRLAAVQYAERWWNDYNPKYKKFTDNCTNFISQCLHAGGAPMYGYPNRSKGWWMQNNNWSYSWTVANSLRWYLTGSQRGLQAKEVSSPKELLLGDIICYDFEGDGRFNHNTIIVAKDMEGYPLVNAQTQNSRMRYWSYYDSTAYTPNIKYKFFHIINN